MSRFLIFDLWGPLSSWGTVAVGDNRPCQAHPTRSALLGLLAGALGIRRRDQAGQSSLAEGVGLAVLVLSRGLPVTDFHTVQVPRQARKAAYESRKAELAAVRLDDNPIVSRRDYRQDAWYSIAVWLSGESDAPSLDAMARALDKPVFIPSLGRKSCPLGLPLAPRIIEATSLKDAFESSLAAHPVKDLELELPEGREVFWDHSTDRDESGLEAAQVFTRRDQPLDRMHWLFAQRQEAWTRLTEN